MLRKGIKIIPGLLACALFLLTGATGLDSQDLIKRGSVQSPASDGEAEGAARAKELISKARQALGGDEALSRIMTLSVHGKLRRLVKYASVQSPKKVVEKQATLSGKLEVNFLMPDRYRKRASGEMLRGFGYNYTEIVNGQRAWRNPPLRAISSNRDSRVIDVDDFERTVELQARGARQQLTLYSLGWLLQPLPVYSLKYSYAGQFDTFSGPADVIVVRGPDNYQFYLLIDPRTSLPLALAATYIEARQQPVLVETSGFFDRRFMMETYQRARREREARLKPPQRFEMHMQFSDHRQVAGVLLPHRITVKLNGEMIEDLILNEFEINRPINPKRFEGEPKAKF